MIRLQYYSAILVMVFLSIQCQKESIIEETTKPSYPVYSIAAEEFVQLIETTEKEDFVGLFAKVKGNQILFERVYNENKHFIPEPIETQPQFPIISIGSEQTPTNKLLPQDFDFAYFNWQDLKLIAAHSDSIYFSATQVVYGTSIHQQEEIDPEKAFSSLKVEGDFGRNTLEKKELGLTPMYLLGMPCPPHWQFYN